MTDPNLLVFGRGNAKLGRHVATFSIPAGKTCPGADICHSRAIDVNGKRKIVDGKRCLIRCFAATQEALFKPTFDARASNLAKLRKARTIKRMALLISDSLPKRSTMIRVHVSGDYFSRAYMMAWIHVAWANPDRTFYGYSKSIPTWIALKGSIPPNLVLTASLGGKYDQMALDAKLRTATIVYSPEQARDLGLPIDHDDRLAQARNGGDFALLIHGVQPAGSKASEAVQALKSRGIRGYSKKRLRVLETGLG
jgi:hypothetical protein